MASACVPVSNWSLHCRKCKCEIVSLGNLKQTLLGSAGIHINLKTDVDLEDKIEKFPNPDPRKRERAPFKARCQGRGECGSSLGSYFNEVLSFSASQVYFKSRFRGEERKWKKWSDAKEILAEMGIYTESRSTIPDDAAILNITRARQEPLPLVYCNVTLTSDHTIDKLTDNKPRDYQRQLFKEAMRGNSLVCLPTGCGKTLIAAMAAACMSYLNFKKLVVFLAPKIPLVQQQFIYLQGQLPDLRVKLLTGERENETTENSTYVKVLQSLVNQAVDVVVMSPDIFLNLLVDERHLLQLTDVALIVFDEAHNCHGNHPYARIMELYKRIENRYKPLILGLSASPVTTTKVDQIDAELRKLLSNLDCCVIVPDLKSLQVFWNRPEVSYLLKVHNNDQRSLECQLESYLKSLNLHLTRLLGIDGLASHAIQSCNYKGILRTAIMEAQNKRERVQGLALAEHAMSVLSVLEVNTVLGVVAACQNLRTMFLSIEEAGNPMDNERRKILTHVSSYKTLVRVVEDLHGIARLTQVKSDRFCELLKELRKFAEKVRRGDEACRGIVFVKMRKTCAKLCDAINEDPLVREHLNPKKFVGHGKGTHGMEWKTEQEPILKEFHSGVCKLLVSTSLLEEGLDVPACSLVIRFDSVMNMRALIQSRGRAARRSNSRFVIMCNDEQEMTSFKQLEIKEKNVDDVVRKRARFSFSMTAENRGCDVRKLDAKRHPVPRKKSSQQRKREPRWKRKVRPSVSVVVYITRNASDELAVCQERARESLRGSSVLAISTLSKENAKRTTACSSSNEVHTTFRNCFEITYSESKTVRHSRFPFDETDTIAESIYLRLQSRDRHGNSDQLFDDVVRTWSEAGRRAWWLERDEKKARERHVVFNILPIEVIAGGDFKDRGVFSELWNHECQGGAEILFLHDMKLVTIAFYNSAGVLHKVEFRYDQLHEFIVLRPPQIQNGFADIFFSLRHVPLLSRAKDYVNPSSEEAGECSFSEYYLRGNSPDDDEAENGVETEEDLREDSDERSDQEDGEELEVLNMLQDDEAAYNCSRPIEDPLDVMTISSDESSSESENEDNSSSFVAEETSAIDNLVHVRSWSRCCKIEDMKSFGEFLALRVKLPYTEDLYGALEILKSFGKRFYYAAIDIEMQANESHRIDYFPPDVRYAHDCLIGLHPNLRCRMTSQFYDQLYRNEKNCVSSLHQISAWSSQDYFLDPQLQLRRLLTRDESVTQSCFSRTAVPAHCALVRRLVLTPTRVIPFPAEVMEQNRVLRHYDPDNFISVSIRDEDYSKLRGYFASLEVVLERIKTYMMGGLHVGGREFQFLACSNSQMRSHGCWFVQPSWRGDADDIRCWMGDLSGIKCVASYMSRLGQCFSTSLDTIGISLDEGVICREIDDVERNEFCFSDGIGTISPGLARQVCLKVGKSASTSALQIRFAGCKGVLCQDPSLRYNQVCIRPSMKKFESPHKRLELLQTSRPQAVYLNQQTIMLLSNLGVPDEIFLNLQKKMLDDLAAMMLDEQEAMQRMSNIIRTGIDYKSLSNCGIALTTEPYFKSLMCALYKERIYRLLKKSRILLPVTEARLMMGVMDETGLLQAGQVFVQCSYMTSEGDESDVSERTFIVKHSVVVTRNPCLHPGDVRELVALDIPQLHHIVDCIVFPRNGPRPHPNEMAGGDLDGDLYFVTWSDDFKPRKDLHEPMNYPKLDKIEQDRPITVQDMVDFYAEYIECDALGTIDNTHKAQADFQDLGVESAECLQLAELHSLAVDAPKTGKWPKLPNECRLKNYPDFMMVPSKPSYVSYKVLGRLFREVRDFEEIMNHVLPTSDVQMDRRLLFPGYEQYLDSAAATYVEYASQLQTLLTLYGIQSEGEMLSGCFHKLKGDFGRERSEIAAVVRKLILQLRTQFRSLFFREFQKSESRLQREQVTNAMRRKASAWYYHTYKPVSDRRSDSKSTSNNTIRFISFPWVVDEVLGSVLSETFGAGSCSLLENISRSIHEIFSQDARNLLRKQYPSRLELLQVVARDVSTPDTRLVMFGSSANFLFRPNSDLDFCILTSRTCTSQIQTLERLKPSLQRSFGEVKLVKDAKVPVIRIGKLKGPRGNRLRLACDISADPNGFLKTAVLVSFYRQYPWLLPLIRFVILWAHATGLTKKVDGARINTNVLVFMMLSFCVENSYILPCSVDNIVEKYRDIRRCRNEEPDFLNEIVMKSSNHQTGDILLHFFKNHQEIFSQSMSENFRQLLGASMFSELLSAEDVQTLGEQMQKAYHVLALHGHGRVLLNISSAQVQRTFTLSSMESLMIQGAERQHARDLARKSGATVFIRPQLRGSSRNRVVEARGTIGTIRMFERVLCCKKEECARTKVSTMSKCFVRGASMITFEDCQSNNDHVTLVPYYGNHHQTHDQRQRHVPLLKTPTQLPDDFQNCHAFKSFRTKFFDQIEVILRDYDSTIHGQLEFVVHFGRIYAFDIPQASYEDSAPITITDFQYSAAKGVDTRGRELLRRRPRFRRPGGSGRKKPKAERKQKIKEGKRDVDKSPNHSLFTVVSEKGMRNIESYLARKGYLQQAQLNKKTYTATLKVGTKDLYVCYDENLTLTMLKLPRLRWFLADIKRAWMKREISPGTSSLDGKECDVRFILGTSRGFAATEVDAEDYGNFLTVLDVNPTLAPYPFIINGEMQSKLQLVRYKETRVFSRPDPNTTQICVSYVKEFSRLNSKTGCFKKVFARQEVVVKPALPASLEHKQDVERFLVKIWKLAFKLAQKASA